MSRKEKAGEGTHPRSFELTHAHVSMLTDHRLLSFLFVPLAAPKVDYSSPSSSPAKALPTVEDHTGEGPDFEQDGVQSEERELTAEEQDESDNDPKNQAAYNEETGEINWDCPVSLHNAFRVRMRLERWPAKRATEQGEGG
jgi:hypothetical protein